MPLTTTGNATVAYTLSEIVFRADGSAQVGISKFVTFADGTSSDYGTATHQMTSAQAQQILGVAGVAGMTRWQDIEQAIISQLVTVGALPSGGTVA